MEVPQANGMVVGLKKWLYSLPVAYALMVIIIPRKPRQNRNHHVNSLLGMICPYTLIPIYFPIPPENLPLPPYTYIYHIPLYIYIHIYIYIHTYIDIYIPIYIYTYLYIYIYILYTCIRLYRPIYAYKRLHTPTYVYMRLHTPINLQTYIPLWLSIYIYTVPIYMPIYHYIPTYLRRTLTLAVAWRRAM